MDKLAILGANGFIGTQAVEFFYLQDLYAIRPVVRSYASLARVARFNLDSRIADATVEARLVEAFKGCRFVLHAALGDARTMINSAETVCSAAEKAGVERIVYLSSLAVHGLNPPEGASEADRLSSKQRFVYNNAKVCAERTILQRRERGSVEVVILRPGIVYGPRSWRWTAGLADDLLAGRAYLANNGSGICNAVYVDNLLESIRLSFLVKEADGEAFVVGDSETVTWLEFYAQIARALKIDPNDIYRLTADEVLEAIRPSKQDLFNHIRALPITQSILPFVSGRVKAAIKNRLFHEQGSAGHDAEVLAHRKPTPTAELIALQSCTCKVWHAKAANLLGYSPLVSFADGMRKSIAWLEFAGYPVVDPLG